MSDGAGWSLGDAPKQSITEVLQNPRGSDFAGVLELPDVSSFEFDFTAASPVPLPPPLTINDFAPYLRDFSAPFAAFRAAASHERSERPRLDQVPAAYFEPAFRPAQSEELAKLQELERGRIEQFQRRLAAHRVALQREMHMRMMQHSEPVAEALERARGLRIRLLEAADAVRNARLRAEPVVPDIVSPVAAVEGVVRVRGNAAKLLDALEAVKRVAATPDDVECLVEGGEYAAAIDAVEGAKAALLQDELKAVVALAPARARLAVAVETIDCALREQFRLLLQDGFRDEGGESHAQEHERALREVTGLVERMGRLQLLERSIVDELKRTLETELEECKSLEGASKALRTTARRAARTLYVIHLGDVADTDKEVGDDSSESDSRIDSVALRASLQSMHEGLQELMGSTVDRLLGSFAGSGGAEVSGIGASFIVMMPDSELTEVNCFEEAKAAMRFGDAMRGLESLAVDLDDIFQNQKKGGVLRAKISERLLAFLGAFHKAHVDTLTKALRVDRWQEVKVSSGAQRLIAAVTGDFVTAPQSPNNSGGVSAAIGGAFGTKNISLASIAIGGAQFKTVAAGVRYARSICAYVLLSEKLPLVSSEAARRGVELSRLFNSLVGRAILGAAALEWSGLRSITARHLSLASRTVAMAAALAERVNTPLEKALSSSQAGVVVPLMRKSEKDFRDHHGQLLAKILSIMMDRLAAHEAALIALPWGKQQEMRRFDIPSGYITTMSKEASVLHRILWSILPAKEVSDIFQRVCAAYGSHLTEAYGSLNGTRPWIRERVAADVTHLHDLLSSLDVFLENKDALIPVKKLYQRFAAEVNEQCNAELRAKASPVKREQQPSSPAPVTLNSTGNTPAPIAGTVASGPMDSQTSATQSRGVVRISSADIPVMDGGLDSPRAVSNSTLAPALESATEVAETSTTGSFQDVRSKSPERHAGSLTSSVPAASEVNSRDTSSGNADTPSGENLSDAKETNVAEGDLLGLDNDAGSSTVDQENIESIVTNDSGSGDLLGLGTDSATTNRDHGQAMLEAGGQDHLGLGISSKGKSNLVDDRPSTASPEPLRSVFQDSTEDNSDVCEQAVTPPSAPLGIGEIDSDNADASLYPKGKQLQDL